MSQEDTEGLAKESFAAIFTALMTRLGACAGLKAEKVGLGSRFAVAVMLIPFPLQNLSPLKDAVQVFKNFIARTGSQHFDVALSDEETKGWTSFESDSTHTTVQIGWLSSLDCALTTFAALGVYYRGCRAVPTPCRVNGLRLQIGFLMCPNV